IVRGLSVRDESAACADENRQVLDTDRALVLARTARRALPEHLGRVDVYELFLRRAGEQRVLGLQDDGLRIEGLACHPRGTVDLTASAFNTRERIEDALLGKVLQRLEAHLFPLEVEVRHVAELARLQKNGERRQHEVEVLRRRDEREKSENDE